MSDSITRLSVEKYALSNCTWTISNYSLEFFCAISVPNNKRPLYITYRPGWKMALCHKSFEPFEPPAIIYITYLMNCSSKGNIR
jgi:hypothetical protein